MIRTAALLCALALMPLGASPAAAQIYRFIDERGTAHYVDGLESVPERYRSRATSLGLRNAPARATPSAERAGASGGATIRFTPGERIVVDARINGRTAVRLLLDTGADRTVIAGRALTAAGVSTTRGAVAGQIVGATGAAPVQAVMIDSLEVGEARVTKLAVVSHDVDQPGIDGLLGRDFLDNFNVAIDTSRGQVTISPK